MKKILSILLVLVMLLGMFPVSTMATEVTQDYELKVLDFEGEYWNALIDDSQYDGELLYNGDSMGFTSEDEAYRWADEITMLSHVLPYNWGTYCYMGGGHAISNYAAADYETYGDYSNQLTVYDADAQDLARSGGGNNESDNFAVHYGYIDGSPHNQTSGLPALSFSDGVARVIDHMYVNMTTYPMNCLLNGNRLTEPGGTFWIKAIGFNGEERTGEVVMALSDGESTMTTEWTKWELSGLGKVTSVQFNVGGSADNSYGFSHPAYFAYDDVAVRFEKTPLTDIQVSDIYVWESETENIYEYYYYVGSPKNTSGKAIIALYSGKKFVGMDIKDIADGDNDVFGSITISEAPDNYRIMLWNGLENLTPLCSAVTDDIG